jgi:hypothetical protein
MRAQVDTPACQARLLHHLVKEFFAEMDREAYPHETSYSVLLNVVMRLAYEQHGEAGIDEVLQLVCKLAEGLERPHLRAVSG